MAKTYSVSKGEGMYVQLSLIREVMNHPERGNTEDYGQKAFQDENPFPALFVANAVHLLNRCRKEATKGA